MFGYIGDLDRTLGVLAQFRRQMDRAFEELGPTANLADVPAANLYDTGSGFVLQADVPGLAPADLQVTLNRDVLTLMGETKPATPEGYSVHRRERMATRFSRSFTLPVPVNPDRVEATLKDGVLTVRVEKADEVRPRAISVKAS